MKCSRCGCEEETQLQESHDVPVYLFEGPDRKRKKQQADKYGRHLLCIKCHDIYERTLFSYLFKTLSPQTREFLRTQGSKFATKYFGEVKENDSTI